VLTYIYIYLAEEPSWIAQFRQQQLEESLKRKKELQEKIKKRFKVKKFSKKERRKVSTRKIVAFLVYIFFQFSG
jgi:hypothetical protein